MNYPTTRLNGKAMEERDRRILELKEQGLTYQQIGRRFGLSDGGIGSALRRAKNAAKEA